MAPVVLADYLWWHYRYGLERFARAWMNAHWFCFHFFSISILTKNLLSPFHRIQERRKPGFDPEDIFETFVINMLMRIVGMIVRLVFIAIGLASEVVIFIFGLILFAFALFLPAIVLGGVLLGMSFLLSPHG